MNLRFRVSLTISLIGIAWVAVMAYMLIDYKRKSIDQEIEAGTRVAIQLLQSILPSPVESARSTDPLASMTDYLSNVGRVRANEVRLYDSNNTLLYESPPSEYKQGRWAPDWFTALVAPATAEIRLPVAQGSIVITPDSSRSVLDAWDELWRFTLFILVFFVLLNIAVFMTLGHTLRPIKDIVTALSQIEQGNYGVRLDSYRLPEFDAISQTFNRMTSSLQHALIENARLAKEEQQRLAAELELEQNRRFTQLIQVKLEEERRAIARELHDELGQCVTAIKTIGTTIASRGNDKQDETRQNAQTIVEVASHIYDVVHSMIRQLRPSALDHLGLNDAIGELAAQYRRQHPQLNIELSTEDGLNNFDENVNITVYRVVQECLTNAVKHAEASEVKVALALRAGNPDRLEIKVSDDGKGMASELAESQRFGIVGIKERVQAFGGEVRFESGAGAGTTIVATLPLLQDNL
ncbi:HAMP domain-containing sensor histidine kinase [Pseudohongiella sp.]|uniref:Oxygen sensor histidine kinase NreB n=1 Tax=marine sediment metagenome TaxID=412755 RepID=A0A0F9Y322_9ZZZZ|nr:sensor histidine kinase [Pseudohongiella sp.]